MPDRDRPRLPRMQRGIWKDLAGAADHPAPFAAPTTALGLAIAEIFRDQRGVLVRSRQWRIFRQHVDAGLVAALRKADLQPARQRPLLHIAAAAAAGAGPGEVDRTMADVGIAVAAEILGREFPVARDQPFLHAQHFAAAVAAVPAVERQGEITG